MYYSIIADEVCDISNKEQLSVSFRYVLDGQIREVFADLESQVKSLQVILSNLWLHGGYHFII